MQLAPEFPGTSDQVKVFDPVPYSEVAGIRVLVRSAHGRAGLEHPLDLDHTADILGARVAPDVRCERAAVPGCGDDELRVKVEACAVCGSDIKTFSNGNPRMKPPIVMGHEFTGLVETAGKAVRGFRGGERIVMATSLSCGECFYCKRAWNNLPSTRRFAEPTSCAVNCVENCGITDGETVVIVGAGPLGILNLSVARQYGAKKLILAQREGKRLVQAEQFRYERLVNTSRENLVEVVRSETGGAGAEVAIVAAPDARAQEQSLELVHKKGRVCLFASLPVGKSMLNIDSRSIHYNEIVVTVASDSTPRQVEKAVSILSQKDFPKELIAHPVLKLQAIQEAFQIMQARTGMRVILKP